jgi:hypothetical protein
MASMSQAGPSASTLQVSIQAFEGLCRSLLGFDCSCAASYMSQVMQQVGVALCSTCVGARICV